MPTYENTGYRAEWWHSPDCGKTDVFYTRAEVRDAERIAAKRDDVVTDESIGHGRESLTVLKACPDCHMMFAPLFGATRCSKCRAKHATAASANARRGKVAAR